MKAAIFGKEYKPEFNRHLKFFFKKLKESKVQIIIYKPFFDFIKNAPEIDLEPDYFFEDIFCEKQGIDIMFSIGGDGTFLQCADYIRDCGIPIVGINTGRLGFLANISKEDINKALENILKKKYKIEERTLIEVKSSDGNLTEKKYALNEVTVQKSHSGAMITIKADINNDYLNTYWADGLIISTPTGSTAYSLSAGGPIVMPNSKNFVITPIAPHNLTVRPLIVSDDNVLKLKITSRSNNFLTSLDYYHKVLNTSAILTIKKANFKIKMLKFNDTTFFTTLRQKLLWGLDKRN